MTVSINPFLMYGKISATVEELTQRVEKLHRQAFALHGLSPWSGQSLEAPGWFRNIYDEMKVVRYFFPGLNVRLDYMGDGIREIFYEISVEGDVQPGYRFVAEFVYEDNSNNKVMTVPFVLLGESGVTIQPKWEKRGSGATPNLPHI